MVSAAAAVAAGCTDHPSAEPELVWGHRGVIKGDMVRPRAVTILPGDKLYIVDFTARIQAYSTDGEYLGITWQTPDYRNGRPSGLGVARDGNIIVCDSHYHTLRVYDPQGKELFIRGGIAGDKPGEFGYISDVVEDTDGTWFVSEFGANERISKLDPTGKCIANWGESGSQRGQFNHTRALALSDDGRLYVADACNHRVQVFDKAGKWLQDIGSHGTEPGQFAYPYDVALGGHGDLYVVEFGNHRVQKLTADGQPKSMWGGPGHKPGQLYSPWALAVDSQERVHVIDTENHRVQRIRL